MHDIDEIVNPECAQEKHENCDLTALDPTTDEIIGCACDCHEVHHDAPRALQPPAEEEA